MSDTAIRYTSELCYELEQDYSIDGDVKYILKNGITPLSMLEASKVIKRKENSRLIKLPIDLNAEAQALCEDGPNFQSINDLSQIHYNILKCRSLKTVIECIEAAGREDIMLKVQGPFSCLLSAVGSNNLFKWLYKHENEVNNALDKITDGLADYIIEAVKRGCSIISLADPSGMAELLGEKLYRKYVAVYVIKLLKRIEPVLERALVHICPMTSITLEKYGFIKSEVFYYYRKDYSEALLELSLYENIKFVGHRCINAEHIKSDKMYKLDIM